MSPLFLALRVAFTSATAAAAALDDDGTNGYHGQRLKSMTFLSPTDLLMVNDNDFSVEGAVTSFWLIRFDEPLWS